MRNRWIACDVEDEFFGEERKRKKQEKKQLKSSDRSKYKKTDQDKIKKQVFTPTEDLILGRVLSITPQGALVKSDAGEFTCSLRGVLKKDRSKSKNLITVGDFVYFAKGQDKEGSIVYVEPRRSILSRADNLSRIKEQLIAANIDLVLITTSVVLPELKPYLIDRYIIAARKGGMEPVIVVNKIDLLNQSAKESALFEEFKQGYINAKVPVIAASTVTGEGIEELKSLMKDKASVFSGQSGVGKSSLINALLGLNLKVGSPVDKTKKGSHTTSTTQLIPLEFGGFCIDTPGIRSFGVWDLKLEEIEGYFSEIYEVGKKCGFVDCTHSHEENCAVLKAVKKGKISAMRFDSYQALRQSVSETHLRR